MNIATMHIGIDVEMQQLNSAVFNKLQHEEKDYILNDVIVNLLKSALNKDDNTVSTIVSYQDIRKYYGILEPFLRTTQLEQSHTTGDMFDVGTLPRDISTVALTSGLLYAGVKYKVLVAGTTDLSGYGGTAVPVVGDIFTCTIPNTSTTSQTLTATEIYRILDSGAMDYTSADAPTSEPQVAWTIIDTRSVVGTPGGILESIATIPTWAGNTELIPVYDTGYHNIIKADALIACGYNVAGGELTKDTMYKVITSGTLDLTGYGAYNAVSDQNAIFTCTVTGTPTWGSTGTILMECRKVTCRLIKMQDTGNFMDHSFGTTKTSPLAILAGDEVRVYHENEFEIEQIYLDYVRNPIEVNYTNSVDSDIRKSLHSFIVKLAARQALGISGAKEYQTIAIDTEEDKKAINK